MEGTVCAQHPGEASIGTCGRCGRFCCEPCLAERDPILCRECLALVGDPFGLRRQAFGTMPALFTGWRLLRETLGPSLGLAVLFALPAFGISWLLRDATGRSEGWALSCYDWLVGVIGEIAIVAVVIAAVEGRRLPFGAAMGEASARWGRAVWANFRQSLWIGFLTVLLVIPGIWVSVMLVFTTTAVVRDDRDALQCSRELVAGRWWSIAWWGVWAALIAYGPTMLISITLEVAIRSLHFDPPPMAVAAVNNFFARVYGPVVMPALAVAAYYQLHLSSGRELPPMTWKTGARRSFEGA